jgi:hypothetical protein
MFLCASSLIEFERAGIINQIPPATFPLTLLAYLIFKLVGPLQFMPEPSARGFLWRTVWEIVKSPWGRAGFRESFVADIFTSLVKVRMFVVMC